MGAEHMTMAACGWLAGVNLLAFAMYASDKRRASERRARVSEAALLRVVWLGGGAGAWAAMRMFRHKTRKQSFRTSFWLIVAAQAVAILGVLLWSLAAGS